MDNQLINESELVKQYIKSLNKDQLKNFLYHPELFSDEN